MAASDHNGPQFEQLSLFSDKVGTGMHDDPSNAGRRRLNASLLIKRMQLPHTSPEEYALIDTLNTSRIPLQHLSDAVHDGLRVSVRHSGRTFGAEYFSADKQIGLPGRVEVNSDQLDNSFLVTHEMGHARHDQMLRNNFGKNLHGGPYNPHHEGVADGYADRYATTSEVSYGEDDWGNKKDLYTSTRQSAAKDKVLPVLVPRIRSRKPAPQGEQLGVGI